MQKAEEFLHTIEIFQDLSGEELRVIRSLMGESEIGPGHILFHQNDDGEELFLVKEGRIAITVKLPDGQDLELSEISGGSFFGEMSIFEEEPRSATCSAKEPSSLLRLNKRDFYRLIETHPEIATKVMYRMLAITAQRLNNTGNFLSDMVQFGENARKRAVTDEFTGLYNRRFLEDALEEQFSQAKMRKRALTIAMFDLDHFGTLNKEYGEKSGDDVILAAVAVFNSIFSGDAILVRYGGDEFTFILYDTPAEKAKELCDRVCGELRKLDILEGLGGEITRITSSIGIASYPEHAKSVKKLMEKADGALYKAKENGRNRTALAD